MKIRLLARALRNRLYHLRRSLQSFVRGQGFRDAVPQIDPSVLVGVGDLYSERPVNAAALSFPYSGVDSDERMLSALCRSAHMDSAAFQYWIERLRLSKNYHRKNWEYAAIAQALFERNLLEPGKRGLGFAVGREPMPALFASFGCEVLATDLPSGDSRAEVWSNTGQWAGEIEGLAHPEICPNEDFYKRVSYQPVDMNHIPATLRDFDFTWSSCSFEHCGSIELGKRFIDEQMKTLKPGGWAAHTTELNLTSNETTLSKGRLVIFRRQDIEEICRRLRTDGHYVEPLDLTLGSAAVDAHVDTSPYTEQHLRVRLKDWASTSILLLIRKST